MRLRTPALTAILLASTLCLGAARAQTGINASLGIPTGEFSSDDEAVVGFGVGLEHNATFGGPVGWVSGLSLHYNACDLPSGYDAEGGNYFTIPAQTGVRITGGGSGPAKFYLQGQAGLVLFIVTDLEGELGFGAEKISADPMVHLGFGGGAGVLVKDRVNLGLRFFGTPEMELSGTISGSGESDSVSRDLSVSMFQLVVGLLF